MDPHACRFLCFQSHCGESRIVFWVVMPWSICWFARYLRRVSIQARTAVHRRIISMLRGSFRGNSFSRFMVPKWTQLCANDRYDVEMRGTKLKDAINHNKCSLPPLINGCMQPSLTGVLSPHFPQSSLVINSPARVLSALKQTISASDSQSLSQDFLQKKQIWWGKCMCLNDEYICA